MADDPRSRWPTHAQVAKQLHKSVSTVRRMREEGRLHSELVDGIHRFDPASIDSVKKTIIVDDDDDAEEIATHAAAELAEEAKRAIRMVLDYTDKLFARYETSDTKKQEYIAKLEESNTKQREAAEAAMSEQNARDLARKQIESNIAVKEKVAKSLTDLAMPLIAAKVGQHFGINGHAIDASSKSAPSPGGVTSIASWLSSLPKESTEAMLGALGKIPREHLAGLKSVIGAETFELVDQLYGSVSAHV